jgi:hypothetical protein
MITDINTQWIEPIAIKNRAQIWVFEALQKSTKRFPFPILGIDSEMIQHLSMPIYWNGVNKRG